ncbi:MAG: DUF3501 family protein [Gammaproteobacteria bacterium]|nr:MAG: DUF3501 family protein [Gammaproteobacteria bacterium]
MRRLERSNLWSLEEYAEIRSGFKSKVIEHKQNRQLPIGPNATIYFEDSLTIQYQIQEMLRIERIFEAKAIEEELDTYNPLIPDGSNWKATFMIEFGDETERRKALAKMRGIEDTIWMQVEGHDRIITFANEDMERTNDDKTSAVHFLRFELDEDMVAALKKEANLSAGISHAEYHHIVEVVPDKTRALLLEDLD